MAQEVGLLFFCVAGIAVMSGLWNTQRHGKYSAEAVCLYKALNSAKVRERVQTSHNAGFLLPGSPSQAGSKPGDNTLQGVPVSLWPLGAAGVQIPLPAPAFPLRCLFCERLEVSMGLCC